MFIFLKYTRIDDQISEVVESFYRHKSDLLKYTNPSQKIMIDNIYDFKDHATSVLGCDISDFISYLINKHSLSKLIFRLMFDRE